RCSDHYVLNFHFFPSSWIEHSQSRASPTPLQLQVGRV
ncbi:hypothetical protein VCHC50A2_1357B, partial [Vibrio cholerae HC-50A2]